MNSEICPNFMKAYADLSEKVIKSKGDTFYEFHGKCDVENCRTHILARKLLVKGTPGTKILFTFLGMGSCKNKAISGSSVEVQENLEGVTSK